MGAPLELPRINRATLRAGLVPAAAFTFVALLVLWPVLGAPFGPHDDYQLADIIGPDRVLSLDEAPAVASNLIAHDVGRFRPAYYPLRTLEASLLGGNATAWHLSRFILLLVSGLCLITLLSGLVPTAGVIVIPLVLLAGPQAEAWIRLAPNEAYGVPLLLGGLVLLRRAQAWPAVTLLLLAGLTKESFAVFNLVLAAWLIWRSWSPPMAVFAAGTTLTVALVGMTFLAVEPIYALPRSPNSVLETLAAFTWYSGLGALAAGVLAPTRRVLIAVAIGLVLLLPQAVIAGGSGFAVAGRYFLPGVLVFVLLAAAALSGTSSWRRSVAVAVLCLATAWGLLPARRMADEVARESHQIRAAVVQVIEWRTENPTGLVVLAPVSGFEGEWFVALAKFVRFDGTRLQPAVTLAPTQPPANAFDTAMWAWMESFAKLGTAAEPCLAVQLIESNPPCSEVVVFTSP